MSSSSHQHDPAGASGRRRARAGRIRTVSAIAASLALTYLPTTVRAGATTLPDRSADPAGTIVDWGAYAASPDSPAGLGGVIDVDSSDGVTLALRSDGTVVSRGYSSGQPPAGLGGVTSVSAAFDSFAALRADGSVVTWGGRLPSSNGYGSDNLAVAAGMGFTVVLKADHTVRASGANSTGQASPPVGLRDVAAVAASSSPGVSGTSCGFALALKTDGTVVGWGGAAYAGCSYYDDVAVQPPAGLSDVVAISAGSDYSLAARADGTVVAWGKPGSPALAVPADLHDAVAVSAGQGQASALRADGTVTVWGYSADRPPSGLGSLTAIAAGDYGHKLAVQTPTPLGSPVLQTRIDTNPAGTAEAFGFTAARTGPISDLSVYLDAGSTASRIQLGVYASSGANPSSLLTANSISAPVAGRWNRIGVPGTTLTAGRTYWLALLAPKGAGKIKFRDRQDGVGGPTQISAQTALAELPAAWKPGRTFSNAPASVFAGPTG